MMFVFDQNLKRAYDKKNNRKPPQRSTEDGKIAPVYFMLGEIVDSAQKNPNPFRQKA
jgi:hypothetical protein